MQENLDKATSWASEQLTKKGIKVTQQEIEELIKSVYSQFKYEFMENWDDVTKEPEVVYNLTFNIEKKEDIEEVMRQIKK